MYDISQQPLEMQERYKELPQQIIELFEYGTIGIVIDNISKEYGLDVDQVALLRMEIEMVLYLFMTREGFTERLQESLEVEQERARGIAQRVNDDLFAIVEPVLNFADEERRKNEEIATEINNEAVLVPPPAVTDSTPAVKQTPEASPEPTVIKPLRTFAEDTGLNRAHGYGAFRSAEKQETETESEVVHRSNQDDIIKQ